MKPEAKSTRLLGVTRSKAKMIEYGVPESEQDIDMTAHPAKLFTLSISLLGSLSALMNRSSLSSVSEEEYRNNLRFSAYFFDAFLKSGIDDSASSYAKLLGSSAYYLSDMPGSAMVLARQFEVGDLDLEGNGLENLLLWLLRGDYSTFFDDYSGLYWEHICRTSQLIHNFFKEGSELESIVKSADRLRKVVYETGTPRELLLADIATAVIRKKIYNSSWHSIPKYSKINRDRWRPIFKKNNFISELWPSQHLLGLNGVFAGESAVVQMPTSAGKTKAIEIIVRSAFIKGRTTMAVIVAPFRALCHEIQKDFSQAFHGETVKVTELSDAYQKDYNFEEDVKYKYVVVATPEKLLYALRQSPEIASKIGLIILDEGHQFDTGARGVTYELLLTSLRRFLPVDSQKVLISAVMKNAHEIGEWINGENFVVVSGENLLPTYRSYGLASWVYQLGQIQYLPSSEDDYKFFVPRILESLPLKLKGKEVKEKRFPKKDDAVEIALFLGFKLIKNGSIAIYCGRKASAARVCNVAVDCFERGLDLPFPKDFSDEVEVARLSYQYAKNLGQDSKPTRGAMLGVFAHHSNTPHGIRLAVEHAMRNNLIHLVACTSTLAQGVNLPIRYLLVTGNRQGRDKIKVRDFHNLIGRVGRASMHTEGSVIFTQTNIIDRRDGYGKRVLNDTLELINPENSENCGSSLLDIFPPIIKNDPYKANFTEYAYTELKATQLVHLYIKNESYDQIIDTIFEKFPNNGFTTDGIISQLKHFSEIIASVECFIMSHVMESTSSLREVSIELAKETWAYFLSSPGIRTEIVVVFLMLTDNIISKEISSSRAKSYAKTFYPLFKSQEILLWVNKNFKQLLEVNSNSDFMKLVWDVFLESVDVPLIKSSTSTSVMLKLINKWIRGESFYKLLLYIESTGVKKIQKTQLLAYTLEDVVDICETGFAYHGSLFFSVLCEFFEHKGGSIIRKKLESFKLFQKKVKYGLPTRQSVIIYELGFRDRCLALEIANVLDRDANSISSILKFVRENKDNIIDIVDRYPSYYHFQLENIGN